MALILLRCHPALLGPTGWDSQAFRTLLSALDADLRPLEASWIPGEVPPAFDAWIAESSGERSKLVARFVSHAFPDDRVCMLWGYRRDAEVTLEMERALRGVVEHEWARLTLGATADSLLEAVEEWPSSKDETLYSCEDEKAPSELLANYTRAVLSVVERRSPHPVLGSRGRSAWVSSKLHREGLFVRTRMEPEELAASMGPQGRLFELLFNP
ncbi:MAG: hypothetical protein H6721_05705 [Sandaracinus sp.]|nr:hypothetical protein [Sandaracinus sp.]MCB9631621.1 hypothetical protein [Sandaracinus sp.]